jgi:hypothetical protein
LTVNEKQMLTRNTPFDTINPMKHETDSRLVVKLTQENSDALREISDDSIIAFSVAALVNTAVARSLDWLRSNTPQKSAANPRAMKRL